MQEKFDLEFERWYYGLTIKTLKNKTLNRFVRLQVNYDGVEKLMEYKIELITEEFL